MPIDLSTLDPDLKALSDDDLDRLIADAYAEQARRRVIAEAQTRAEQVAADYAAATEGAPPLTWEPGTVVGPGRTVVEAGDEYVNISGAWLSVPPSQYRLGYRLATAPDTEGVEVWAPGQTITVDDRRTHAGIVYVAIQAHTTQAGWEPPAVPALWAVA